MAGKWPEAEPAVRQAIGRFRGGGVADLGGQAGVLLLEA